MDMHELWDKTCEKLKAELNRASYQTWIETNLTPKARLRGGVLPGRRLLFGGWGYSPGSWAML